MRSLTKRPGLFIQKKEKHKTHFRHEEETHWAGLKDLEKGKEVAKLRRPGILIRSRHRL